MIQEEQTPQWSHVPFASQVETGETGETRCEGMVVTGETEEFVGEFLVETVETVELETKTESGNVEESRSQSFSSKERSLQGREKGGKNWRETETDPCSPVKSGSKHRISRGDTILLRTPSQSEPNRGNPGRADDAAEVGIR